MNDWRSWFTKTILARGRSYWEDDRVYSLHRTEENIVASVIGNDEYRVEIDLQDDVIEDMFCTCPYAEGGDTCKHMAAVLFAVEAGDESDDDEYDDDEYDEEPDWREILRRMPEAKVRLMLYGIVGKNKMLQDQIVDQYRGKQR